MNDLRVSLCQLDIVWEDKKENLELVWKNIQLLKDNTDLIILPEMFSTGFSMNSQALAETNDGETIKTIKRWATALDCAICGSFIAKEDTSFYNRGFFITSNDNFFYDKKHLFRMGEESKHFSSGNKQMIVSYKNWNIMLQTCYDLRFPAWCRNIDNNYDLLIFVASWPKPRAIAWNTLLKARAIENLCYVAGVNRVGKDFYGNLYKGDSQIIDMKGEVKFLANENEESISTSTLSLDSLNKFRDKFPAWKDADKFTFI